MAHTTFCPKCNLSRFKGDGKQGKIFKYLPLSPRLARIYQNENLVALLQLHVSCPDDGVIFSIHHAGRMTGLVPMGNLMG